MSIFKTSIIFITILIISGCVSKYPETVQVDNSQNKIQKCPDVYKVVKGDTIFSLSIKCGFDYKEVAAVNNIKKPYKISEGEEIRFDLLRNKNQNTSSTQTNDSADVEIKILDDENDILTQDKKKATQEDIGKPVQINEPIATREIYNPKSVKKTKEIIAQNTESLANRFIWPTEGEVLENFNPDEGKKGIGIQGTLGQEIKSIAKGR
ncbi:MAG: LysM peptidoglycan-binding domain-containing protein, partial [Methylophilaceae bacterium]